MSCHKCAAVRQMLAQLFSTLSNKESIHEIRELPSTPLPDSRVLEMERLAT
jgi:hypothetical protein